LRAFPQHAFTGDRYVILAGEYRYLVWPRMLGLAGVGVALFAGQRIGMVSRHTQAVRHGGRRGTPRRVHSGGRRDLAARRVAPFGRRVHERSRFFGWPRLRVRWDIEHDARDSSRSRLYLALQLGIGVWIARRIRNESDYLLAGRSLGYTFATFSIFATWFGSETVVGSAGNSFRDGVSFANAEPFGYGLCLILMGIVFAGPLWRRRLTTLADLFRQRYSVTVERLAAVILIPGSILWAAAQIRSFGYVVSAAAPAIPIDCRHRRRGGLHAAVHRCSVACWLTSSTTCSRA
jgi:hypothetical protein